jgi:3-methyladenine DNA glycosylase/8-oxoguanine DNA glycosylase
VAVPPAPLEAAVSELAGTDPVLADLVDRHGPPPARRRVPVDRRFGDLARNIVYQQLAGRAAASIHGRFVDALDGDVCAARVLATPEPVLRSCGLSGSKTASILDLADKVAAGEVALERIGRLSDQDVVAHLTVVRGVGPWTAQMFLMSTLGRLDVWPVGDYGVRAGFARAWGLERVPAPTELESLGEPFRPWRSLVAWYCWRAVDER